MYGLKGNMTEQEKLYRLFNEIELWKSKYLNADKEKNQIAEELRKCKSDKNVYFALNWVLLFFLIAAIILSRLKGVIF